VATDRRRRHGGVLAGRHFADELLQRKQEPKHELVLFLQVLHGDGPRPFAVVERLPLTIEDLCWARGRQAQALIGLPVPRVVR
jgi:hypothetical protein